MSKLLSTKEVANYLNVNEKMVYALIAEKKLPASKVTGKWLFPSHLVDQWIETNTINFPERPSKLPPFDGLLVIAGSNDPLLDQAIELFNSIYPENMAVFGNLGSMGGIGALRQKMCHIATSHLLQNNSSEYNFEYARQMLNAEPVLVNFCNRQQGLIVAKKNPHRIKDVKDLAQPGLRIVNRKLGAGTRQLFDQELKTADLKGSQLNGYHHEVSRHIDIGLTILNAKADAGPGIQPVAKQLGLDFIPWRWERYDLLIPKEHFFNQPIQNFLAILHESRFNKMAGRYSGYDISMSGKMLFANAAESETQQPVQA
ncbi:MAG: helix-turn-helix transcriptional regulator [Desulfobacteraceae bacterium]|nr:helix-turn-helix transcriptional regulator [Desulfobacteraceae bacterium]